MIAIAEEALRDARSGPEGALRRYVKRDPLGVVFTIAPWNYPYLTAVNSVIPAIMAGNAVILQHSASTLLVAERFQQAFDRAVLPERCVPAPGARSPANRRDHRRRLREHGVLHRVGGGWQGHGTGGGGAVHQRGSRARWQGPRLRAAGRQPAPRDREPGGRCLLQFRAELLRHRAHLRPRECLVRLSRRLRGSHAEVRARLTARPRDDAGPDGASRGGGVRAEANRVGRAGRRTAEYRRHRRFP